MEQEALDKVNSIIKACKQGWRGGGYEGLDLREPQGLWGPSVPLFLPSLLGCNTHWHWRGSG